MSSESLPSKTTIRSFLHPTPPHPIFPDDIRQAHRPRNPPAHHLVPRRRGRPISPNTLTARAAGNAASALVSSSDAGVAQLGHGPGAGSTRRERQQQQQQTKGAPAGRYESAMVSPGSSRRECCPYLFQRGMVVSEEGVRGGQDHLRSDEVRVRVRLE